VVALLVVALVAPAPAESGIASTGPAGSPLALALAPVAGALVVALLVALVVAGRRLLVAIRATGPGGRFALTGLAGLALLATLAGPALASTGDASTGPAGSPLLVVAGLALVVALVVARVAGRRPSPVAPVAGRRPSVTRRFAPVARLAESVSVYVPATVDVDSVASPALVASMVETVSRTLAGMFGGATVTDGLGSYVAESGALVQEPVRIVASNADTIDGPALDRVAGLARKVARTMGQECVAVNVNGTLYLVGPDDPAPASGSPVAGALVALLVVALAGPALAGPAGPVALVAGLAPALVALVVALARRPVALARYLVALALDDGPDDSLFYRWGVGTSFRRPLTLRMILDLTGRAVRYRYRLALASTCTGCQEPSDSDSPCYCGPEALADCGPEIANEVHESRRFAPGILVALVAIIRPAHDTAVRLPGLLVAGLAGLARTPWVPGLTILALVALAGPALAGETVATTGPGLLATLAGALALAGTLALVVALSGLDCARRLRRPVALVRSPLRTPGARCDRCDARLPAGRLCYRSGSRFLCHRCNGSRVRLARSPSPVPALARTPVALLVALVALAPVALAGSPSPADTLPGLFLVAVLAGSVLALVALHRRDHRGDAKGDATGPRFRPVALAGESIERARLALARYPWTLRTGEYLRTWWSPPCVPITGPDGYQSHRPLTLTLRVLAGCDNRGVPELAYRLALAGETLASGRRFYPSPLHAIDSDASAGALLAFMAHDAESDSAPDLLALNDESLSWWGLTLEGDDPDSPCDGCDGCDQEGDA
jgi:hypothetical protein